MPYSRTSGLGARSLFGVEDTKVYPLRGQTILVYSPNVKEGIKVFPPGEQFFYYLSRRPEFIMSNIRHGQIWEGDIRDTTSLDPWDGITWGHS